MNISFHPTDNNQGNLLIKIDKQDYNSDISKEIDKIRKNAKIKGFRQGAVPMSMIQNLYGESIKADILNKLVNKAVENYQKENNLNFLGDLLPVKEETKTDLHSDEYSFEFKVGIAPVVDLDKFISETKLPKYKIQIKDSEIEEEKTAFLNHYSTYDHVESAIQEKDMVKLQVQEMLAGNVAKEGITSDFSVLVDEHLEDEFRNQLIGLKNGDTLEIDIRKTEKNLDENTIRKYFLKIDENRYFGDNYLATIESVSRKVSAVLNEELFKKAYGEDTEVVDETSLKARLKEDLASHYENETNSFIDFYLYKQLVGYKGLEYPDNFLKEWLVESFEDWSKKTQTDIDHDLIHFKEGLNWQIFKSAIGARAQINIDISDVRNIIISRYQAQIPGLNFSEEQWNQVAMNIINDKEKSKEFINEASNIKHQSWLKDQIAQEEIEISIEEFKEKVKDLKAHKHDHDHEHHH